MTRKANRRSSVVIGALVLALIAVGVYLAFAKRLPFGDRFEVKATFASVSNLRPTSPVRIAGVDVGRVTAVERLGEGPNANAAQVTMELDPDALPIHDDARFKLRQRLPLEGNMFVDLSPGTPGAAEVGDGYEFGIDRTATSVQLDEVLSTLDSPVRADLQVFLDQLGRGLVDYGGARGLNRFYDASPLAFAATARVADASLGRHEHDLSGAVRGIAQTMAGLGRDPHALAGLVGDLSVVSGALAVRSDDLELALAELPGVLDAGVPAFAQLNRSLPELRALAIDATPGVRRATGAVTAATPWARELARLMSPAELRGLAREAAVATPPLTRLTGDAPALLDQVRALASCVNEVVIPWSEDKVSDPLAEPTGRVFEELGYGLVGVSGESRSFDANGAYIRALAGAGANTVEFPASAGRPEDQFGVTPYPLLGAVPSIASSQKTPFRPTAACERQAPPDLRALVAPPGPQSSTSALAAGPQARPVARLEDRVREMLGLYAEAQELSDAGDPGAARAAEREAMQTQAAIERGPMQTLAEQLMGDGG